MLTKKVKPDRPFPFVVAPGRPPLNLLYKQRIGDQHENAYILQKNVKNTPRGLRDLGGAFRIYCSAKRPALKECPIYGPKTVASLAIRAPPFWGASSLQVLRERRGRPPRYSVPAAGGPKLAYAQISKPLNEWAMMRRHVDKKSEARSTISIRSSYLPAASSFVMSPPRMAGPE